MTLSFIVDTYYSLSWYYCALIIIAFFSLLNYILSIVTEWVHESFVKKEHPINDAILTSAIPPLHLIIIVLGFTIALQAIGEEFEWEHVDTMNDVQAVASVCALIWFLIRLVEKIEAYYLSLIKTKRTNIDRTYLGAVSNIAYLGIFLLASIAGLQALGFSVSGILAFGGVSGVVAGFASRDILANFLGAATIYLDKTFKVGDWVKLPEKHIEGHVEYIGLRSTVLRSLDKRPIYIPNSTFTTTPIENPSKMSHRQINETFSIRSENIVALKSILYDINIMLDENMDIDKKQICCVNCSGFSPTSINITIVCFTRAIDYADFSSVKEKILLGAAEIIAEYEAKTSQKKFAKSTV
jgi:MscS family membrane protein